ncbi:hypothetical protein HY030_02755 [Candidatus Gottesmanbacteria bacterium]|nr:hypothetical protein [Candidatus Gottesmanbacteria bacterium]
MNEKMKSCFTPHVLMHSLFGLGLGIVLVSLVPSLNNLWIGVVLVVVGLGLDMMRK